MTMSQKWNEKWPENVNCEQPYYESTVIVDTTVGPFLFTMKFLVLDNPAQFQDKDVVFGHDWFDTVLQV